jgi:methionyl-tRNA formyltransferase
MTVSATSLRIVFAGTPQFAVPTLDTLLTTGYNVCAVYTQPDRPAGRGRQLRASPIKVRALQSGLWIRQPSSLRDAVVQKELAALAPDLMIVVAYGLIIPKAVLEMPPLGCVNVHASLLPRWRGAAPIQRALLAGDRETGISIMQMDEGLDTGPVLGQTTYPILRGITGGELHDRLASLGAQTLIQLLPDIAAQKIVPQHQDEHLASYAAKLEKAEANLNWSEPAINLERKVLAFNPWPVAQTRFDSQILRIWQAKAHLEDRPDAMPGTVIRQSRDGIDVVTGEGVLRLTEVQLFGKRAMPAVAFNNAHHLMGQILISA